MTSARQVLNKLLQGKKQACRESCNEHHCAGARIARHTLNAWFPTLPLRGRGGYCRGGVSPPQKRTFPSRRGQEAAGRWRRERVEGAEERERVTAGPIRSFEAV